MDSAYFDELIEIQQDAITSCKSWWRIILAISIFIVLTGVVLLVVSAIQTAKIEPSFISTLPTLCGVFTGSLSFLPYKEITPRRLAIAKFNQLKKEYRRVKKLPKDEQLKALNDISEQLDNIGK